MPGKDRITFQPGDFAKCDSIVVVCFSIECEKDEFFLIFVPSIVKKFLKCFINIRIYFYRHLKFVVFFFFLLSVIL